MVYQVPAWEGAPLPAPSLSSKLRFFTKHTPFSSSSRAALKETPGPLSSATPQAHLRDRLDRVLPPHRTYFGRSRRTFLLALFILLICLLALILGLAIGISRKKSSSGALPLPSNTATFTGDLTYYAPGLGACGTTASATDLICAVSMIIFDAASTSANPNNDPLCGRRIRITRFDDRVAANSSVDVTVVDRCVACLAVDLDLSPAAFAILADPDLGRVKGSWAWLPTG